MDKGKIKKIIFVGIVALLAVRLMMVTFSERVDVIEQPIKTYEVSQEDIISSGQEITIKSFDYIDEVTWLSDQMLKIEGLIGEAQDEYLFDLQNNELLKLTSAEEVQNYPDYEIITTVDDYGVLAIKEHAIGLIKDAEFKVIIDDISFNGINQYKLSTDKSKLLLFNANKHTIVTYNFKKNFYKTINLDLTDTMIENFDQVFQLSPVGGYISVAYEQTPIETSYFKLFGADSGRLYAEDVYGVALSWAPDDSKLCYYYAQETKAVEREVTDGLTYTAKRIGYYDVSKKKIEYLQELHSEGEVISKIHWNDQTISILTGVIEENNLLSSLITYDFNKDKYNEWRIDKGFDENTTIKMLNDVDAVILLLDNQENHEVLKINKNGEEIENLDGIVAFDTLKEKDIYFYQKNGCFITADVEKITVSNGKSQGFIQLDTNDYVVIPNNDLSHIAVWFKGKHEVKILNTN